MKKAVAYYRTSSKANVRGDSMPRQRRACRDYCATTNTKLAREFYDAGVSGTMDHASRPAYAAMVAYCIENSVTVLVVAEISRFSRDLMTQEVGYADLKRHGITLVAADAPGLFGEDTDPTRTLIRHTMGAMAEFQRAMTAKQLYVARRAKAQANKKRGVVTRSGTGKCEGRKGYHQDPQLMRTVRKLNRKRADGSRRSLAEIGRELARRGFTNSRNNTYGSAEVVRMLNKRK